MKYFGIIVVLSCLIEMAVALHKRDYYYVAEQVFLTSGFIMMTSRYW